jgi:hypothetical protein
MATAFSPGDWIVAAGPSDDGLFTWIAALGGRFERGELDGWARLDLGFGSEALPSALMVAVMLADLDHFDSLVPERRWHPVTVARRLLLLEDFRRLRQVLG